MTSRWMIGTGVGVLAAAGITWFVLASGSGVRERGLLDYRCDDPGRVYVGRLPVIRNPAVVESARAYAVIPEFVQLRAEGLSQDTPRYQFLMKAASDRFLLALRALAARLGHDVVAEVGAIRVLRDNLPPPPDITEQLLHELPPR